MGKKKSSSKSEQVLFEDALERLEQIVHDLEDGQLGLSESLERYQEGVKFLRHCHLALEQAEQTIAVITGLDADGEAISESFEEATLSDDEKPELRTARRTRNTASSPPREAGPGDMDTQPGLF